MKLLITGGRDFAKWHVLCDALDALHDHYKFTLVIHGGARGADHLADQWAAGRRIPAKVYSADWKTHGRAAGPIRNQQMLDEGKPDLVVAFPGGRGTSDMVARAKRAGVEVMMVESGGEVCG